MALRGLPSRNLPAAIAAALVLGGALGLSGCASSSSSYAGIPLAAGAADADLQQLARRAQAGDKQAQLDLGIHYEEGRGLPQDLVRAEKLYAQAAKDSRGIIQVYSPPVGQDSGKLIPLNLGPKQPGLAEAKARLERLR